MLSCFNYPSTSPCRTAESDAKPRNIYRFTDAREVEIVARVCRQWNPKDDEVLEPEAVRIAEIVMKVCLILNREWVAS